MSYQGVPAGVAEWRKSSYSRPQGECVEVGSASGWVGVRDSKLGEASPVLAFTSAQWRAFLASTAPRWSGTAMMSSAA